MMPERDILQQVDSYRKALLQNDEAAIQQLVLAYDRMYKSLLDKIDLLMKEIEGKKISKSELLTMQRYKDLVSQLNKELDKFQALTIVNIEQISQAGLASGVRDSQSLMKESSQLAGITANFNVLPKEVIQSLLGFLDPNGRLFARLGMLAKATAQVVSDAIIEGVGLGKNPKKTASDITSALGMGLTDAMRNVRTVQLWAYREATRANYLANQDVLQGWVWHAELDETTCMSCLSMHGTIHSMDEVLDDHYNGRCAMIPLLKGQENPVTESGEAWFKNQPESVQKEMMGSDKWQAYQNNQFQFSDLTGAYESDVYGEMKVEKSLADLVKE